MNHLPVDEAIMPNVTVTDGCMTKCPKASLDRPAAGSTSAVTSTGGFVPEIDGLRFFAIASVVAFHVSIRVPHVVSFSPAANVTHNLLQVLNFAFDKGYFGVQLRDQCFILSLPFASHYLLGTRKPLLRTTICRRVTRLEPPYLISLVICFLILLVVWGQSATTLLPHALASAIYSHGFVYGEMSLINGVLWSLEVEVQFYILATDIEAIHDSAYHDTQACDIHNAYRDRCGRSWSDETVHHRRDGCSCDGDPKNPSLQVFVVLLCRVSACGRLSG